MARSQILILRSLWRKGLQESTVKRVLQIILDTQGEEESERIAATLMEMVDSSKTEAELLRKLDEMQ